MKKLFQIASLVVVTLLAVQPALAGLPCAAGITSATGCAPDCGMAMGSAQMSQMAPMASAQMSPDCGMTRQVSSSGCAQNCCGDRLAPAAAQPESGAKSTPAGTPQFIPVPQTLAIASSNLAAAPRSSFHSAPPPPYILFHVFRIQISPCDQVNEAISRFDLNP